jgi:hypothetical protein
MRAVPPVPRRDPRPSTSAVSQAVVSEIDGGFVGDAFYSGRLENPLSFEHQAEGGTSLSPYSFG